ncbi:hypothetical protein QQ045_033465 [Rhodiola kirilowii]
MAEICVGVVSDGESTVSYEPASSRAARRRRMEIRKFRFVSGDEIDNTEQQKRQKLEQKLETETRDCRSDAVRSQDDAVWMEQSSTDSETPKFGFASVCGRRRDMEDAVDNKLSFSREASETKSDLHYFGVFDGHGCSHVRISTINDALFFFTHVCVVFMLC